MSTENLQRYTGWIGKNNVDPNFRLASIVNPRFGGLQYLQEADNVDMSKVFDIRRRDGYARLISGGFSSLWGDFDLVLGLEFLGADRYICRIDLDNNTYSRIRSVSGDMATYLRVEGTMTHPVMVSDGAVIFVTDGYSWSLLPSPGAGMGVGRTVSNDGLTNYLQTFKRPFPACHILAMYRHRVYGARGNTVVYSDAVSPFRIDVRNFPFQFDKRVRMIAPMQAGIYFGTETGVWWYEGGAPKKIIGKKVSDAGVIENTAQVVEDVDIAGEPYQHALLVYTKDGIGVGTNDGKFEVKTSPFFETPNPNPIGASMVVSGEINQYKAVIQ